LIDPHGDHLFTCCKRTDYMFMRHDAIVRCLAQLASEARICKAIEPRRCFHDVQVLIKFSSKSLRVNCKKLRCYAWLGYVGLELGLKTYKNPAPVAPTCYSYI
jgi:hypothetical protein